MKTKNYIDNFYYIFFGLYFIICFAMSILILLLHTSTVNIVIGAIGLVLNLLGCFFFYIRAYFFEPNGFKIKIGCFTKNINYKDVNDCYMTKNNVLSYATSQKRIGLDLEGKNKHVYISPEKMDDVLVTLTKDTKKSPNKSVKKTAKKAPSKTTKSPSKAPNKSKRGPKK